MDIQSKRIKVISQTGVLLLILIAGLFSPGAANPVNASRAFAQNTSHIRSVASQVYLPLISTPIVTNRVNIPYFENNIDFNQMAIFWFGKVTPSDSYTDVRIGYSQTELFIHVAVFDRRLWYDTKAVLNDLTKWDAVSLFLNLNNNSRILPTQSAYRFDAQINWWENSRTPWQAVYQSNGTGWGLASLPFTTESGWRGNAPNDNIDDRGWIINYHIPFTSLGLTAAPAQNTAWGIGMRLHDRDSMAGPAGPDNSWPELFDPENLSTWGQLGFGMPGYAPMAYTNPNTTTIRQGLNGAQVVDGMVGGGSICGQGLDFWNDWGLKNYSGEQSLNIQNQLDVADWPCYSKYYVTFPLSALPSSRVIVSAKLTLHLFGNAGDPGQAAASFIQVMRVNRDWDVNTLSWNNAPGASENYAGTWVNPMSGPIVWPGVAYDWDISRAVADAYREGNPLRLVLYESDGAYHSGKYFVSSNADDWNAAGRPTVQVTWGNPLP